MCLSEIWIENTANNVLIAKFYFSKLSPTNGRRLAKLATDGNADGSTAFVRSYSEPYSFVVDRISTFEEEFSFPCSVCSFNVTLF
jgi:hypothetical protein